MEQAKARAALEPYLALCKSATSPRAAADLVVRATSAPHAFVFAELLQTPQIQSLANAGPDYAPYLTLLQIFSYGTVETYAASAPQLPKLVPAQKEKLQQLSLLSLVRNRDNLTYGALRQALGLASDRELENLVISAIYADLLTATLDPACGRVQVSSVAPLRDPVPGAIPETIATLREWDQRCSSTLDDITERMRNTRSEAAKRERDKTAADDKLKKAVSEIQDDEKGTSHMRRGAAKRSMMDLGNNPADAMDVDDALVEEDNKRTNKRKL